MSNIINLSTPSDSSTEEKEGKLLVFPIKNKSQELSKEDKTKELMSINIDDVIFMG